MKANDFILTDDQLKRALGELAAGPDADLLAADVMRVVDATPQARGSAWRVPWTGRAAAIAATVLLVLAIGGTAVLLSGVLPEPPPDGEPGVLNILPGRGELRYVIPEGSGLAVHQVRPTLGWYQFNERNSSQGPTIDIFPAEGFVHPCPLEDGESSRVPVRSSPHEFLVDLREIQGTGVVGETATAVDGYPAWTGEIDPAENRCGFSDLHFPNGGIGSEGPYLSERPGNLTVVDVDGSTFAILVTAPDDEWPAFEPVANAFLQSIEFEPGG